MSTMTAQIEHALTLHGVTVCQAYRNALSALDDESYLPDSRLMLEVNRAMLARPVVAASRFRRHAAHEASGSRFIAFVAEKHAEGGLQRQLWKHAKDEARHSRIFTALAAWLAPGAARAPMEKPAGDDGAGDPSSFNGDIASFLVATHLAEIRNLALLGQYRSILAAAPGATNDRLRQVLDRVHADESHHVAYTAAHVSQQFEVSPRTSERFEWYVDSYVRDAWAEASIVCGNVACRSRS